MTPPRGEPPADLRLATVLPGLLHRLATPVGTIVNYLYLLEDDPALSPDARETLAPLRRATDAIADTLAEARRLVEAAEMPLRLRALHPAAMLERAAAGRDEPEITGEKAIRVQACPDGLALAFAELLGLLAPHAGEDGIRVRIQPGAAPDRVALTWDAAGAPWSGEACSAPTQAFADPAAGHDAGGAGMAIVATLLHRMGGSIRREVRPDGGARVIIELERDGAPSA